MSPSNSAASMDPLAFPAKAQWEDPAITLERRLEVRGQGGPGDSFSPQGAIGPFNTSGDDCMDLAPGSR